MNEKICIEFSGEEFYLIVKYADLIEADTLQTAIMNAINTVMDGKKECEHK